MQRDEPGDAPDDLADGDPSGGSEWAVEDFDDFESFEREHHTEPAGSQVTLAFGESDERAAAADPDDPPAAIEGPDNEHAEPAPMEPEVEAGGHFEAVEEAAPPEPEPEASEPEASEPEASADSIAPIGDDVESPMEGDADGPSEQGAGDLGDPARGDGFDDTVEGTFQGGQSAVAPAEGDEAMAVPDFASFTSEQYMQTTTQEFVDLAADMELASQTEHVPSAVAAEMRGLDSGIIGLDDVMAAAGEDPLAIPARRRSDLALRVFTGLGLSAIFLLSVYEPLYVGLFMLAVLLVAAGEFYTTLVRSGFRPVGLFGLLGTLGALAGTWVWGPIAIPIAVSVTLVVTLLFFGIAAERRSPMTNTALTVLGTAWIGGLGAFIFDMVEADLYGWLIVSTVVTVALMDISQFFFGRRLGRHRLAPRISPHKTVEGLVGGVLVALVVGLVFGLVSEPVLFLDLEGPIDLGAGLALGFSVAVAAPLGDLAVSILKRAIGVKDMGTLLPGHGGVLDRVDAMLFAIPFAWIVFAWTGLLN